MLFPKAPASCGKKFLEQRLLHYTSICMNSKSVSDFSKILFQTGDIFAGDIFALRKVFFSRYVD